MANQGINGIALRFKGDGVVTEFNFILKKLPVVWGNGDSFLPAFDRLDAVDVHVYNPPAISATYDKGVLSVVFATPPNSTENSLSAVLFYTI